MTICEDVITSKFKLIDAVVVIWRFASSIILASAIVVTPKIPAASCDVET